jgi:hypothetical protein
VDCHLYLSTLKALYFPLKKIYRILNRASITLWDTEQPTEQSAHYFTTRVVLSCLPKNYHTIHITRLEGFQMHAPPSLDNLSDTLLQYMSFGRSLFWHPGNPLWSSAHDPDFPIQCANHVSFLWQTSFKLWGSCPFPLPYQAILKVIMLRICRSYHVHVDLLGSKLGSLS